MKRFGKKILLGLAVLLVGIPVFAAASRDTGSSTSSDGLTVIKVLGKDHNFTTTTGQTVKLSDWVSGRVPSKIWDKLVSDLAARGIKLELDLVAPDQIGQYFQNLLVQNKLNDYDWIHPGDLDDEMSNSLIDQGRLYPLNKAIDLYSDGTAKNYYANTEEGRYYKYGTTYTDGNFYWLNNTKATYYKTPGNWAGQTLCYNIRKDYLDRLGLPIPTTLDEFYDTIVYMREHDANGDGLKNEVIEVKMAQFDNGIAQWFGIGESYLWDVYDTPQGYKIRSGFENPNVKAYIEYMQKLYKAGLIGSGDASVAYWVHANGTGEVTKAVPAGFPRAYAAPFVIQAVPGVTPLTRADQGISLYHTAAKYFIPSGSKNVEAVVKFIDYFTNDDYWNFWANGIEGYTYTKDASGKITAVDLGTVGYDYEIITRSGAIFGYEGFIPRHTTGDIQTTLIEPAVAAGTTNGYPEGFTVKGDYYAAYLSGKIGSAPYMYDLTGIPSTPAELAAFAKYRPDHDTYGEELLSGLITGSKSLANWDTYMADLKRLGMEEIKAAYQSKLDRVNASRGL